MHKNKKAIEVWFWKVMLSFAEDRRSFHYHCALRNMTEPQQRKSWAQLEIYRADYQTKRTAGSKLEVTCSATSTSHFVAKLVPFASKIAFRTFNNCSLPFQMRPGSSNSSLSKSASANNESSVQLKISSLAHEQHLMWMSSYVISRAPKNTFEHE